ENDRNCTRRVPYHSGRWPRSDNQINVQPDQFRDEIRVPFSLALGEPVLDGDILVSDPAEVAQALFERLDVRRGGRRGPTPQIPDLGDLLRLLRLGGERRSEEAASDHAKERPSLHHSIT